MKKRLLPLVMLVALTACSSDVEVTVTTSPQKANVFWENSLQGETPLTLQIKNPMELILEAPGYKPAKVMVYTNSTDPLVVPMEKITGKVTPLEKALATYPTSKKAKAAYRSGELDKKAYRELADIFTQRFNFAMTHIKELYSDGKIGKNEYRSMVEKAKKRYQ